jgi:hypothetical protein
MWLVRLAISARRHIGLAGAFATKINDFNGPTAIAVICRGGRTYDGAR